jgi:hypothetical protein
MIAHSGTLADPHSLTVAGAAQAWRTKALAPASRLTHLLADEHLKAARTLTRALRTAQISGYKLHAQKALSN